MKTAAGIWLVLPMSAQQGILSGLLTIAFLCIFVFFTSYSVMIGPYASQADNIALVSSGISATFAVFIRSFGQVSPGVSYIATVILALAVLVTCATALFSAMALASVMIAGSGSGSEDRMLRCTVDGWLSGSSADRRNEFDREPKIANHAVEVTLVGPRVSFAINMPAIARQRVAHVVLLPPAAGDREALPRSTTTGDRAKVPVPSSVLFPAEGDGPRRSNSAVPLVALMAPSHPGVLVYAESALNDEGTEWGAAVRGFFGKEEGRLADEAERLVNQRLEEDSAKSSEERTILVIEVLPAHAPNFVPAYAGLEPAE